LTKGQPERGVLRSRAATPGQVNFPCVEPVARWRRQRCRHSPETVALGTSLPAQSRDAAQWRQYNRAAWSIERGPHQRLDVPLRDDQGRVRLPQSLRVIGLFGRLSNSRFPRWRGRQKQPRHKTTTGFFGAMHAEHHRHAIRCLQARQPSFRSSS
jgi:hypothetical protein